VSFAQPADKWEPLDFLLILAYESLQSFKCPECGDWIWKCSNEVKGTEYISYNIHKSTCKKTKMFCEHMDAERKKFGKDTEKFDKSQYGLIHRIEPFVDSKIFEGKSMPTFSDYIEQQKS
jgi:hypothetical protein